MPNKHTQQQLLEIAETEPEKLNELVAIAQGWQLIDERPLQHFYEGVTKSRKNALQNEYFRIQHKDYSPTTNDGQAWRLMVVLNIGLDFTQKIAVASFWDEGLNSICTRHKNPNIAVAIAAILYLQEKNND